MAQPRVLEVGSKERRNLLVVAGILSSLVPTHKFAVEDIYFDYGQKWLWTTIVASSYSDKLDSYQMLDPKEWEDIIIADTKAEVLGKIADELFESQKGLLK